MTPVPVDPPIAVPTPPTITSFAGAYWGLSLSASRGNVDVNDGGYNSGGFTYSTSGRLGAAVEGGYNWQSGSGVLGLYGQVGHLGVSGNAQEPSFVGDPARVGDSVASIRVGGFVSVGARLGVVAGRSMFYARAGLTAAQVSASYVDLNPTGTTLVSGTTASGTRTGATLGLGVEHMMRTGTTVYAEISRTDLGRLSHTATSSGGGTFDMSHRVQVDTLRLGVNFRF